MASDKSSDIDLDEDLFDFEPVAAIADELEDEEADLDEIFATFQAEEEEAAQEPQGAADDFQELDDDEDDIFGDLTESESAPAAAPVAETAPAPPVAAVTEAPAVAAAPAASPAPEQVAAQAPTAPVAGVVPAAAPPPGATAGGAGQGLRGMVAAATGGGPMSRSALWILLAAMSLNGLVAIVLVSSTGQLRDQMNDISDEVEETIRDIRSEYWGQKAILLDETTPIAAPNPENHPAFERALAEIEAGQYAEARQRLYALLAVVDRLDSTIREKVESRATYLIGHAWHLEALQRLQAEELGGSEQ